VTQQELDTWAEDFESFHARFAHLFARSEPREQSKSRRVGTGAAGRGGSQEYLADGGGVPRRFAAGCDGDLWRLRRDWRDRRDGVPVKKGDQSVGVKRQYSGTAGKAENCQIGAFLIYASRHGRVFLDRRLYLPEEWCSDRERREQACVSEEVVFQTKPQQAVSMLQHALEQGVPMRWVTGDEVYGDAPYLREAISRDDGAYLACHSSSQNA